MQTAYTYDEASRCVSQFTGKERDTESGLDMFGARYYGSSLGRFMTPDWAVKPVNVPYAHFGNPQSLNLYSYVQNNPTTVGDPDGHDITVPDGPKKDEIKKALVDMAMRPGGRQLLQAVDDSNTVVPIQNVEKQGDLNFGGNRVYDSFDPTQLNPKTGEGTAPLTVDLDQAKTDHSVDPKNQQIPESDAVLIGHGLTHADAQLNNGKPNTEADANSRARGILSEKPDMSKKDAQKFVEKIIQPKQKQANSQ